MSIIDIYQNMEDKNHDIAIIHPFFEAKYLTEFKFISNQSNW